MSGGEREEVEEVEVHESHRLKPLICCRWPTLISGRRPSRLIPGVVEVEEEEQVVGREGVGGGVRARAVHRPL